MRYVHYPSIARFWRKCGAVHTILERSRGSCTPCPVLDITPPQELSKHFTLRVLLCHVDVDDSEKPLLDINRMAVLNDFTLILAWSIQVSYRSKCSTRAGVLPAASFSSVSNRLKMAWRMKVHQL